MSTLLHEHLASGVTHTCHCWAVDRRDGISLGFTDHDQPLNFDGRTFSPNSGFSAKALAATTGLSVNNTEAVGALSADAITEADIEAGRYDGAQVTMWLVQWDNTDARQVQFSGTIGEMTRAAGQFRAELRGLAEALNQPQGRSYLKSCSAVLGDGRCGFDASASGYMAEVAVDEVTNAQVFEIGSLVGFNDRWFEHGMLEVLTGAGAGLSAVVKHDATVGEGRKITLWQPMGAAIVAGDQIRLIAGCDKQSVTCREKFANFVNFQGFPDIPGEDWLVSIPRSDGDNSGGSLMR